MKKILIFIFIVLNFNSFALAKNTTFTNEIFQKAQLEGKTVVINSWNKTCTTCAKQVKILEQAKQDFKNIIMEMKYNFNDEITARNITKFLPGRVDKNSKYVNAIERTYI